MVKLLYNGRIHDEVVLIDTVRMLAIEEACEARCKFF